MNIPTDGLLPSVLLGISVTTLLLHLSNYACLGWRWYGTSSHLPFSCGTSSLFSCPFYFLSLAELPPFSSFFSPTNLPSLIYQPRLSFSHIGCHLSPTNKVTYLSGGHQVSTLVWIRQVKYVNLVIKSIPLLVTGICTCPVGVKLWPHISSPVMCHYSASPATVVLWDHRWLL